MEVAAARWWASGKTVADYFCGTDAEIGGLLQCVNCTSSDAMSCTVDNTASGLPQT